MINKRGYTLVELLIVLGISGILISLISSFFINNANSYKRIDNETELQYQAQFISNFIADKMMESNCIKDVYAVENNKPVSIINQCGNNTITKIIVENGSKKLIFEKKLINRFFYSKRNVDDISEKTNEDVGKYISEMKITSIPETDPYSLAKCIKLELIFKKGKQTYSTEQIIYFRNFSN